MFVDVSKKSLNCLKRSLSPNLLKKSHIQIQDLNFISLKENEYDFIFCANVLHHIINLEHLLLELNKSLKKDGIIIIDDFIGENKFQFSDERISLINSAGLLANKKYGIKYNPMLRTSRKSLTNSCPFEAIRSNDIPNIIEKIMGLNKIKEETYGAVSSWANVVIDINSRNYDCVDKSLSIFIEFDKFIRKNKILPPLYLFGVYRKNLNPPKLIVLKWSKKEQKQNLHVSFFDEGTIFRMGEKLKKTMGNGALYHFLKNSYIKIRK
jgi:SAM-dependent methyltransferase